MSPTRREFLAGAAAAAPLLAQKKGAPARPNIILVLADDLAAWMLGCYGNQEIKTPNIDLLARTGTRFANNFVCTPICSASRATLFTGRVPRQHGIHDFLAEKEIADPPQGQAGVPPSFSREIMISDLLAGAGYNCGYTGKWHMGGDEQPQHGYKYWNVTFGNTNLNPRVSRNGQMADAEGYTAELITRGALEFLDQQQAGQPFFLTVSHFNPHVPYTNLPQKYYDLYAKTQFHTIGWERPAPNALRESEYLQDMVGNIRKCAASVSQLDDQIPPLLKKLQERGLRDNTLIVFTGDNGFLLGRHGLWSKGHASNPINMFEEVVNTPLIWSWMGKVPPEAVRPELVSFYDMLPALCEVAGVQPPQGRSLCGRSYLPLALNQPFPKKEPWRNLVFGHFRNTEMARDGRYKLVLRNNGQGPNELYDVREDPRERVNRYQAPEYVSVRDRLTRELDAWRKRTAS